MLSGRSRFFGEDLFDDFFREMPALTAEPEAAAKAGETSRQAIARELFEETGIQAAEEEFELLDTGRDGNTHYDYYCIRRDTPIEEIVLLPGETDDVQWATFEQVREMIAEKKICRVIARQFNRQEQLLLDRQERRTNQ